MTVDDGFIVSGAFGDKCEIIPKSRSLNEVKFKNIEYSCVVQLNTTDAPDQIYSIYYYLGDSDPIYQDCTELIEHHPKANTFTERNLREHGYISDETDKMLVGWETEDGEYIGLGSRVEVSSEGSVFLSAVWKDYSDTSLFIVQDDKIIDYIGTEEEVVIPRRINGNDITRICANAFENCKAKSFYIPSTVTTIENEAFKNCETLTDFYMSDNIAEISDMSFCGCKNFTTLHVNAILDPVYMDQDAAKKADVLNRLSMYQGKKLVVTAGSNVMFGFDTDTGNEIFNDFKMFNLGLTAGIPAIFWKDLMINFLGSDDIYIHAPERNWGSISASLRTSALTESEAVYIESYMQVIFYIFESDWSLLKYLKINEYCSFIDIYHDFTKNKYDAISQGQNKSYSDYNDFLNDYGTVAVAECSGFKDFCWNFNGHFNFEWEAEEDFAFYLAGEKIYEPLAKKGVKVFFSFPTMNKSNLLQTYFSESELEEACIRYTEYVKRVLQAYPITVLLSQLDSVYPSELFYNTDYHLGHTPRIEHTRKILEAIKPYLEELN